MRIALRARCRPLAADAKAWLDNATRALAKEKLSQVVNKIGYPDEWPQYAAVQL